MPSAEGQRSLLLAALADAGASGADVEYVEAHGTGTAIGDPVELEALGAVMAPGRRRPCGVGSIKTNLGHLESAAGAAGVAKVALSSGARVDPGERFYGRRRIRGSIVRPSVCVFRARPDPGPATGRLRLQA